MLEALLADIRYTFRWLRRSPGFTFIAVASFAVGIGFNTALFSLVDAVLFKPLPIRNPGTLVDVFTSSNHDRYATSSYLDFVDMKAQNKVFEDMLGFSPMLAAMNLGDRSRLVNGEIVTGNYFQMLGVRAALGRTLTPSDDRLDAPRAVMISDGFWRREMGGDPAAVGRDLRLRGQPYTIVGIAPARFNGMFPIIIPEIWLPAAQAEEVNPAGIKDNVPSPTGNTRLERRGARWMFVKGRLKPGVTVQQAGANLAVIMDGLRAAYPATNKDRHPAVVATSQVRALTPEANGPLNAVGLGLMLAVGMVLLVGCANVASMLLVRAASRQKEIAIRLAIGASRGQIVRQLIVESLLLASFGAAAGVLLAWALTKSAANVQLPIPFPLVMGLTIDGRVLVFTVALAALAGLVAGLIPAMKSSRPGVVGELRGEIAGTRVGGRRWTLRDALVAGQIAITVVLLACGGLFARSLLASRSARLGFRTDGVALLSMDLDMARYDTARSQQLYRQAIDRVRALPGVHSATMASMTPFSIDHNTMTVFVQGLDAPGSKGQLIDETDAGPDYFKLFDIPIVQGRAFTDADTPQVPGVAIVSQTAARRFWPGENPIGKIIRGRTSDGPSYQIVGVSADYKLHSVGEAPRAYLHLAFTQRPRTYGTLVARTSGDAEALLAQVRKELLALEPNIVFIFNQTMAAQVDMTLFPVQAGVWMVNVVGLVAVLLAGVGLYGVIAYSVARRTREIGIRMALGAWPGSIVGLVMRQGLAVSVAGLVGGVVLAALATRVVAGALYGVSAADPVVWIGTIGTVLLASALANLAPARRAAHVGPTTSLRTE